MSESIPGAHTLLPGADPFTWDGAREIGVVLCHGFTSTPQSMRPWGEHLHAAGYTVTCPLLPGHGTRWQELNRTRWTDWYGAVEDALLQLRTRCSAVAVAGQSMGGALALRLAQQHPDVAGVLLVNPSVATWQRGNRLLPVVSRVVPALRGISGDIAKPGAHEIAYDRLPLRAANSLRGLWRQVRADLPTVHQPVVVYRSTIDHVVEPANARIVLNGVGSQDRSEAVLPNSHHVATLDHDAPTVFSGSVEFLHRIHRDRAEESS
ncbi:alpha/beta hydrolase [Salinifilum ghardaiensis]